ncbi:MAG: CPBP family intramembrane metalloprotease [Sphingobacteriales bacterium]|nr:MAG: CPBP family intramembrane metalloprotease [Sphingobacteriales bacterium]
MIGILVQLVISWLLLWFVCKKHLVVLGFRPTRSRLINAIAGLFIAAFCCTLWQLMTTAFIDNGWVPNKQATARGILERPRWTLVSVLFEELIFRGVLLYIAIKKLGVAKACILSAICFGIYHWFSYNVFGNPFLMFIVFAMTATVGLSWAFAFARTGSLYLPIGLHFGWNLLSMVVFSNGHTGQAMLVKANGNELQGGLSLFVFLFQVLALPLLTFWYLKRLSKKEAITFDKAQPPLEASLQSLS